MSVSLLSLQHLTINASIYTLVAVALDRYRGIMFPLKGGYSKFRAKMAAVGIWALSITMAIPNLVVYHVSSQIANCAQMYFNALTNCSLVLVRVCMY